VVNLEENKERFELLILTNLQSVDLINYLEETDFFIAPASTKYHGAYEGGLCEHCLNVYDNILKIYELYRSISVNKSLFYSHKTLTLVSLLHDVCKINIYETSYRNQKKTDEKTGKELLNKRGLPIWEKIEYYMVNDTLPLGHGEKSVIILQRLLPLTIDEIIAIRWHMGGYDDLTKTYIGNMTANNAFNNYPLVTLLHMADLASIFLTLLTPNSSSENTLNEELIIQYQTEKDLQKEMF
jgi:hypothetical protein